MHDNDEQQAAEVAADTSPPHPLWDIERRRVAGRTWVALADVYKACGYQGGGGTSTGIERIEAFGRGTELQKIAGAWWVDMDGLRLAAASMCKVDARDAVADFIRQTDGLDRDRRRRPGRIHEVARTGIVPDDISPHAAAAAMRMRYGAIASEMVDHTQRRATRLFMAEEEREAAVVRSLYQELHAILVKMGRELINDRRAAEGKPPIAQPQSASDMGEGAPS